MTNDPKELKKIAKDARINIVQMLTKAGSGHTAGSLGIIELLVALYFAVARIDPKKPNDPDRDRIVLSAGHLCPALYSVLSLRGFFPQELLWSLRKLNSPLQGHPRRLSLPGVENSSGSLGQGISVAVGMALAGRLDQKDCHIWCVSSDGEQDEGQVWETLMCANKYSLGNFTLIIDRNQIQIDGYTEEILPLEPLAKKYQSFGFNVEEVSGHSFYEIIDALISAKKSERPSVIIAHTTAGKGVSFIENKFEWHGKAPNEKEAQKAIEELKKIPDV